MKSLVKRLKKAKHVQKDISLTKTKETLFNDYYEQLLSAFERGTEVYGKHDAYKILSINDSDVEEWAKHGELINVLSDMSLGTNKELYEKRMLQEYETHSRENEVLL